ncbi:MAG: ABC transporter ATP-binding protein [Candidatus Thalassarchaeaceae archaeon]|mgnify:FL=1|tara:strand:+ start:209 stop:1924 length:1716 start_codon:yes stop_codon:yes gene_type:complete
MTREVLEIEGLRVHFDTLDGPVEALNSVDLKVDEGQIMGLVGESGCGKTVTSLVSIGLATCEVDEGSVRYQGEELLFRDTSSKIKIQKISEKITAFGVMAAIFSFFATILVEPNFFSSLFLFFLAITSTSWLVGFSAKVESRKHQRYMRWVRGNEISMIFQEPMSALNPLYKVSKQISEVMREHDRLVEAETPRIERIGSALLSPFSMVSGAFSAKPRQSSVVLASLLFIFAAQLSGSKDQILDVFSAPIYLFADLSSWLLAFGTALAGFELTSLFGDAISLTLALAILFMEHIFIVGGMGAIYGYGKVSEDSPFSDISLYIPHVIATYLAVFLMIWMPLSGLSAILVICALLALPFIIWSDFLRLDPAHIRQVEGILDDVRIPDPKSVANMYPHELSGGMRQRVMIGMMMACEPKLLIADEPTTALDVTIQAQILNLMKALRDEKGTAILLITHDLGVIAEMCDDVTVMYAGRVVERASVREIFSNPLHAYTRGLIACTPSLESERGSVLPAIPGQVANPSDFVPGCRFCQRMDREGETLITRPEFMEVSDGHWVENCPICLDESQDRWV